MNALAVPSVLKRPRTFMVAAAGLATAASIFAGTWSASADSLNQTLPSVPGAPQSVEAKPGDAAAKVRWIAPEDNGGSPIVSYTVVSNPGNVTATTGDGQTTSVRIPGLENGTAYTFTVIATNASGNSEPSSPSNEVTPRPRPNLDELIERIHAHFQRAVVHSEAHAALASEHAAAHAKLAIEHTTARVELAMSHSKAHMELRQKHLESILESAKGTPREEQVRERVEKAMTEMNERFAEKQAKLAEKLAEHTEKVQDRLEGRLEKIGDRLEERKSKLEERRDRKIEQVKERWEKAQAEREGDEDDESESSD